MKVAVVAAFAGALVLAVAAHPRAFTNDPQATATSGTKPAGKEANVPPPIQVDVISVDPKANTITVREIAAVPAPPGKPVELTLDVPPSATGQKLADTKAGQKVAVTCTVKPTVHKEAGVPIILTDCLRVIKIDPKS